MCYIVSVSPIIDLHTNVLHRLSQSRIDLHTNVLHRVSVSPVIQCRIPSDISSNLGLYVITSPAHFTARHHVVWGDHRGPSDRRPRLGVRHPGRPARKQRVLVPPPVRLPELPHRRVPHHEPQGG